MKLIDEAIIERFFNVLGNIKKKQLSTENTSFTHGEMAALFFIKNNQGVECTPSIISHNLGVTRPTITSALNSLEKKQYIIRENLVDRRKTSVVITPAGEAFLMSKYKEMATYIHDILEKLGQEDSEKLLELLEKVYNQIGVIANDSGKEKDIC